MVLTVSYLLHKNSVSTKKFLISSLFLISMFLISRVDCTSTTHSICLRDQLFILTDLYSKLRLTVLVESQVVLTYFLRDERVLGTAVILNVSRDVFSDALNNDLWDDEALLAPQHSLSLFCFFVVDVNDEPLLPLLHRIREQTVANPTFMSYRF